MIRFIDRPRVILDTNVALRGVLTPLGASGKLMDRLDQGEGILLLSDALLREYRGILFHPDVRNHFAALHLIDVEKVLMRLRYRSEKVETAGVHFAYDRDPKDAKLIELAIAGRATHLVTFDKDLLDLTKSRSNAGKRFRQRAKVCKVCGPAALLLELEAAGK